MLWQAAVEAASWLVDWIKGEVEGMITGTLGTITEHIDKWTDDVSDALMQVINEYESTGSFSEDNLKELNDLFMGNLYWLLTGIAIAILAALTFIMPFTVGISTIISIVISLVITTIIWHLFSSEDTEGTEQPALTATTSITGIIDTLKNFLTSMGAEIDPAISIITFGLAWYTFMFAFISLADSAKDASGYIASLWGFRLAFFAMILAFSNCIIPEVWLFALTVSFIGMVCGLFALKGVSPAAQWAGGLGIAFTLIAMFITLVDMEVIVL